MAEGMWLCGCNMEMELAEEMGWVGKCIGCQYYEILTNGSKYCRKRKKFLEEEITDCELWVVDTR